MMMFDLYDKVFNEIDKLNESSIKQIEQLIRSLNKL